MNGFITILCSIGIFVALCCFCSLLQAWRRAAKEAHFEELYSKYSKENLKKIKGIKKKTKKEIMMLREEIKIAEERLLAEHKYEKRIADRLKDKEKYQGGIRRRKLQEKNPKFRRKQNENDESEDLENYSNENYDTEPDSDLENLLERRINDKPDVERGKDTNHFIPKRNLQHSYKNEEDSLIEQAYSWWNSAHQKDKLSDACSDHLEDSPSTEKLNVKKSNILYKFNQLPRPPHIKFPRLPLNWPSLKNSKDHHTENNDLSLPSNSKYREDMLQEDLDYDLGYYKPKNLITVRKQISLESSPSQEINVNNQVIKIQVDTLQKEKHERIITKVEDIFSPTTTAQAWGSPLSQASNTSIDLPFFSPESGKYSPSLKVKLTPLKTPPLIKAKNKSQDYEPFSPNDNFHSFEDFSPTDVNFADFSPTDLNFENMSQILNDDGLLYSTGNVDIFKPNSALDEADDEYSDL